MDVVGVRVELPSNQPIVLLREADGPRYLPIWIGGSEATAIATALKVWSHLDPHPRPDALGDRCSRGPGDPRGHHGDETPFSTPTSHSTSRGGGARLVAALGRHRPGRAHRDTRIRLRRFSTTQASSSRRKKRTKRRK